MTSKEWCDIIFEGKNKNMVHISYALSQTHRNMIVIIALVTIIALPFLFMLLVILFTPKEKYDGS